MKHVTASCQSEWRPGHYGPGGRDSDRSDAAVTGPSRRVKTDSEYCMIPPPALRPPRRRQVTVAVPGGSDPAGGGSDAWLPSH